MKLGTREIQPFLANPVPPVDIILLYGPDAGLVRERASLLVSRVVEDSGDPFLVSDLDAREVRDDPARLADEAGAVSMIGGRRAVLVRRANADRSRDVVAVFEKFLENVPGDALIVVEAGDLQARTGLRRVFENASNAVAVPCYADEGQTLDAVIRGTLRGFGLAADPAALAFLVENLGGDRGVTRQELEKLALYVSADPDADTVTLADSQAIIGNSSSLALEDIANAVATGNARAADADLERSLAAGDSPVAVLGAVTRHFTRLHLAAGRIAAGATAADAMGALRPPVFFMRRRDFERALARWTLSSIEQALERLLDAETACKTTGLPDSSVCRQTCLLLAARNGDTTSASLP